MKNIKGITLIALVVTIIVLLILAGITITMIFNDNGIIKKAQDAVNKTNEALKNEMDSLDTLDKKMDHILGDKTEDGIYDNEKDVNIPKLKDGMTPIKWDETNEKFITTTVDDKEWYDYTNKKWANAITSNGDYWVWIPRFCYQIETNYHKYSVNAGIINVEFMKGTSNISSTGRTIFQNASGEKNWNIHPAFNYGVEVPGIWVAKYEASQSDSTYMNSGTSFNIKVQPTVRSWVNKFADIGDIYIKCLNYNTTFNSHLMKNTEWGAVAYLSKSKYGKDNIEVGVNRCSENITGMGPGGNDDIAGAEYTYNVNYIYNTVQGQKASTNRKCNWSI